MPRTFAAVLLAALALLPPGKAVGGSTGPENVADGFSQG
jgi:hypothetical protein